MKLFTVFLVAFTKALPMISAFSDADLYIMSSKYTYTKGLQECKKNSMSLVKITDLDMNKIVYDFAQRSALKNYFIDLSLSKTDNKWLYSNGTEAEFKNFKDGQPDNYKGKESCVNGFNDNGKWDDVRCDIVSSIVCYSTGTPAITETQIHLLNSTGSFDTAITLCKDKSMNLIKLNDPVTNLFVQRYAKRNGFPDYWFDATDKVKEGEWCNNDGTKLTYLNFRDNQPDNYQNDEHCAQANRNNPTWNDLTCDYDLAIVCQSDPPVA